MPPISTSHVVLPLSSSRTGTSQSGSTSCKPNCNSKMVAASAAAAAAVPCRSACLYSYWHTRKCSYHHLSCTCLRLHTGCCRTLLRDRTLAHSSLLHMCSCSCHHLRRTQSREVVGMGHCHNLCLGRSHLLSSSPHRCMYSCHRLRCSCHHYGTGSHRTLSHDCTHRHPSRSCTGTRGWRQWQCTCRVHRRDCCRTLSGSRNSTHAIRLHSRTCTSCRRHPHQLLSPRTSRSPRRSRLRCPAPSRRSPRKAGRPQHSRRRCRMTRGVHAQGRAQEEGISAEEQ